MEQGYDAISQTLARRLRDIARVLDRLDRLEAGSGSWLAQQTDADLESAALQMTLRVLQVSADPYNFTVLRYLAGCDTSAVSAVQDIVALDRITLSERINDLVQVGLVVREIDTDHVQITDAGKMLVQLFNDIQLATAQHLRAALSEGERGKR